MSCEVISFYLHQENSSVPNSLSGPHLFVQIRARREFMLKNESAFKNILTTLWQRSFFPPRDSYVEFSVILSIVPSPQWPFVGTLRPGKL